MGKNNRAESDQLLTVYTKNFGKLEILARAVRKIKSKLRAGADIFYLSDVEFIQGKAYKTLTDGRALEKFKNIRKNPEAMGIASQVSEICGSLIKGQEAEEGIWNLLNEVFRRLDNGKLKIILYYFIWNFLSLLGYRLDLYHCVSCQKKLLPEKLYIDLEEGGIVCSACFQKNRKGEEISLGIIKILRLFLKKEWPVLDKLRIEDKCGRSLQGFSEKYLSYHTHSQDFLL